MKKEAIINPIKGRKAPTLGPVAVMVSSETDLRALKILVKMGEENVTPLMMSNVYVKEHFSLTGPIIGAPYSVMILESLIAWGARRFIFFGWCGAVSPDVRIGDIILPTSAIIDEGTSRHYDADEIEPAISSGHILQDAREILRKKELLFHEGTIWTLDAIYRETPEKVAYHQTKNVLGVEMELSALFTVGKFRDVDVGGLLVVSDEISSLRWKPGFKDKRFKKSRMAVAEVISEFVNEKQPQSLGSD